MHHTAFHTISQGLDRQSPALRLYEKAKRLGVWNPSDIDLQQDQIDWRGLTRTEQDLLLRLTAMFQAGEEAVTLDLLPLVTVIAEEGRLDETMYLTTFLFEEAKHTDFFSRFIDEVADKPPDLATYHTADYRAVFYEALPRALTNLKRDASPAAQVRAASTYNMVVEGVLAETGYHAYLTVLEREKLMPGTRQAIQLLKRDESRHIAYGVYLLSRLIASDPDLWQVAEATMNELLVPALGIIGATFSLYDPMPFGLVEADFVDYALSQFQKRLTRLEQARTASPDEIVRATREVIDREDG